MSADILIAGGGPAGSLLATLLARRGQAVTLLEASRPPRHKLCGEFLSGEAAGWLTAAGLGELWTRLRGTPLHGVALEDVEKGLKETGSRQAPSAAPLPAAAQGVSRFALDAMLLEAAQAAGAKIVTGARVAGVSGAPEAWRIEVQFENRRESLTARQLVAADGRRAALAKPFSLPKDAPFALKFHVAGAQADDVTHLYFYLGGYGGVNAVENGLINCCFILPKGALPAAKADPLGWLRKRLGPGFLAGGIEVEGSRCATGPLQFGIFRDYPDGLFAIGDAAVAIDPFCGDGMAMAMEGAILAAPLIAAAATKEMAAAKAANQLRRDLKKRFIPRLRAARLLRFAAMRRPLARLAAALARRRPQWLARAARATRGAAG
jgi:flavin-dependent dehydrogenase